MHHAVLGGMQHPGGHPLVDHHAQFILGHGVLRRAPASEQAEHEVGEAAEGADQG